MRPKFALTTSNRLLRRVFSQSVNWKGLSLKRGTGNGEQGTGNGERGTGNGERGTGNGERGTGNGERGTGNGERGTGNGERGTGNGERGTGNGERYICKGIFYFNFHLYVLPDFFPCNLFAQTIYFGLQM